MEHEAWLVDLDGTLYRALPVKAAMAMELAVFGLPVVARLRRFRRLHEAIRKDGTPGGDPYREQLERAAKETGHDLEALEREVAHWMQERPSSWIRRFRRQSLLDEITSFRASGGRTALVSDYPARIKLEGLGVTSLFDVVVASGEEGGPPALKPDPAGYLLAAERLSVPKERCLVIGDREDADGEAARRAGMTFRRVK